MSHRNGAKAAKQFCIGWTRMNTDSRRNIHVYLYPIRGDRVFAAFAPLR